MTAKLAVRVQPGARRSGLLGLLASGEWKLSVTAPPDAGRANEAVVSLLAELLGVQRRQVSVVRGHASRQKQIEIEGLEHDVAEGRLRARVPKKEA